LAINELAGQPFGRETICELQGIQPTDIEGGDKKNESKTKKKSWTVISMKNDWKQILAFNK
jgi:hypothetical protein